MSEEPRFAPNGNRLPERLPIGHRLVDTTKQQWLIGPSIGCGGFGDIYLTRQYDDNSSVKRLTQDQIIRESSSWTNVIKFEHFSGPLFAEINFYLRCARRETIEEYMVAKKFKHLGMPRFVASGIYDPIRSDNPPPVCKNTMTSSTVSEKPPTPKRGRKAPANGGKKANGVAANGKPKRIPASVQSKEKKYRFLVLQRFGDDIQKIWTRANKRFDMKSAFNIALKVIDTLEYIHSHGYVHADVKASNLLIEWQDGLSSDGGTKSVTNGNANHQSTMNNINGHLEDSNKRNSRGSKSTAVKRERPKSRSKTNGTPTTISSTSNKSFIEPEDQIYLVDFGLVERFSSKDGTHREHVEDQRRANNGTVEFSSRDAHIGAFSRRSDLESLAYNLLYWVSGGRLPWTGVLKDHQLVEASKRWYMDNLEIFVNYCFNEDAYPIDPLKLLKGKDPHVNGHSSNSTSASASTPTSKSSSSSSTTSSSHNGSTSSIMCAALYDFLSYITKLGFADEPDYYLLKSILSNTLGARTSRKRCSLSFKKTSPKMHKYTNPTPAMREILKKMKNGRQS